MSAAAWILAGVFVVAGILAYTGLWKGWIAVSRGYGAYMGFALLYIGAAFALAGLAVAVAPLNRAAFIALVCAAAILLGVAVVGFWWLPPFLVPAWFQRLQAAARARAGGGS